MGVRGQKNPGTSKTVALRDVLGRILEFCWLWEFSSVGVRRINFKKFYLEPKSHDYELLICSCTQNL